MTKRLTRSSSDKILGGVCGGLANYLNIDAGLVRLLTAAIILLTGFGPIAYLLAWFLLPDDSGRSGMNWVMGQIRSGTGHGDPTANGSTGNRVTGDPIYRGNDLR